MRGAQRRKRKRKRKEEEEKRSFRKTKKGEEEESRIDGKKKKKQPFSLFTCCRSRAAHAMTLPYMAEFIVDSNLSLFCSGKSL